MATRRGYLTLPLLLAASVASAIGAEVRDTAGLFSPDAIQKANAELSRVERETGIPVTIETTPSLNGQPMDMALIKTAQRDGVRGLFILIPKQEGKVDAAASREFQRYFSRPRLQSIYESFIPGFKRHDFDAGLNDGVAKIANVLASVHAEAKSAPAATAPPVGVRRQANAPVQAKSGISSLIGIVLLVLAVIVGFKIISGLLGAGRSSYGPGPGYGGPGMNRGPGGYGAPGYGGGGGGGGGFMSSLFGGIGGAMAGNWIYDQFSGRRHHDQVGGSPDAAPLPPADAGPEWQDAGDGGGDWGGGGTGGGGGDWGGGGGGDWGGGGGGGDWGGGGGDGGGSW